MKKQFILVIFALIFVASKAQTDADDAEMLLESLYLDAQNNLADLQETWSVNGDLLDDNQRSWQATYNDQSQECEYRDGVVQGLEQEQENNENFLDWLQVTIKETVDKHKKNYDDRCEANRNYIHGLKNDKILIRLIEFLRAALESKTTLNLAERRELTKTFLQFLQLYRVNDTKGLLQLHVQLSQDTNTQDHTVDPTDYQIDNSMDVSQRTDEQIGTDHIDQGGDNINVDQFDSSRNRTFAEYKAELLALLDEMQSQIESKMGNAQEDEVNAGIAAAEFRLHLEKEMQELDAELYVQIQKSSTIAKKMREAVSEQQKCKDQLALVEEALNKATEEYFRAFDKFSEKRSSLEEELEIFEYVLQQYKGSVSGDAYREQLDDYTQDGSYEGTYDEREVDQIDFVEPQQ